MTEINKHNINKLIVNDVKNFMKQNKKYTDLQYGKACERQILESLKTKFEDQTIKKTKGQYNCFDFEGLNKIIELKSRRNNWDTYPTTMIGLNKIKHCLEDKDYYFIFKFLDCVKYCKYNKDDFDNFEIKKGGRYDRTEEGEISDYVYIPIEYLSDF